MALPTYIREVLHLRELILKLKSVHNISEPIPKIGCTLFEDNKCVEKLAKVPKKT